jgi:hypothetical protein
MKEATTMPYVKKVNELGEVLNPLNQHHWDGTSRKTRRSKETRAFNNSKNCQMGLSIDGRYRFRKMRQFIGNKQINHLVYVN